MDEDKRQGPANVPLVVVVDDDDGILKAVDRTLRKLNVEIVLAHGPAEALRLLSERQAAVVMSDYMMPGMNGIELLSLVRQKWPSTIGIMMTACEDIRIAADAVNRHLVNAFITKPWDTNVLRQAVNDAVETNLRNHAEPSARASVAKELELQASNAAFSLARAVDARDRYTHSHSEKVAVFGIFIGRLLGLDSGVLEDMRIGGLLHDLGKIGVSDGVLLKAGRLTDEEYKAIRLHPVIGTQIIEPIPFSELIRGIVRYHHENHDGSGYPDGIAGADIPLPSRIIHVVDAYEAMSANRIYRSALPRERIIAEFERCRGTQFDPDVTDIFLRALLDGSLIAAAAHILEPR